MGGRGEGWAVRAGGEPKAGYTIHKETDSSSVSPVGHRNSHSRHGRPRPCSGPTWFSRVGKRPPVKADLAIYSPVNGVYV